jgi:hypothetical protein
VGSRTRPRFSQCQEAARPRVQDTRTLRRQIEQLLAQVAQMQTRQRQSSQNFQGSGEIREVRLMAPGAQETRRCHYCKKKWALNRRLRETRKE